MPIITAINAFLQDELARRDIDCVTAVEAARWLEVAGLLRDSPSRPGKPLRALLRGGLIAGQRQELNSRWLVCRVGHWSAPSNSPTPVGTTLPRRQGEPGVEALVASLLAPANRVAVKDWPGHLQGLTGLPGLYAWWVDDAGAATLAAGIQHHVAPGLIYGGQTGAGQSSAILGSRIGRNHMKGNIRGSTFRWTLASVLQGPLGLSATGYRGLEASSESTLTRWIHDHLAVSVVGVSDRSTILATEEAVLRTIDPPLNLLGMGSTSLRVRLSQLRRAMGREP